MRLHLRLSIAVVLSLLVRPLWAVRQPDQSVSIVSTTLDPAPVSPQPARPTVNWVIVPKDQLSAAALSLTTRGEQVPPEVSLPLISYFQANPQVLNVAQTPELRADYVEYVPGLSGLRDRVYVRLVQTAQGLDVADTSVTFSFDPSIQPLRLDSLQARLYPAITASSIQLPDDRMARQQLVLRSGSSNAMLLSPKIRWMEGVWQALREYSLRENGLHAGVNAVGRSYVWDERVFGNYAGQITGRGVAFDPLNTGSNLNTLPLADLKISDGSGVDAYTNAQGTYNFTTGALGTINIGLTGRWGEVIDLNHSPLAVGIPPGAFNPVDLLFNPTGNLETNTAQVNAYVHENIVHAYIEAHGVNPFALDTLFPINVNENSSCNSYFDGVSIHFFKSGGGCLNSAYDTLIYHEYGHFIDYSIGGIANPALSEGWGDIMAMFVSGQSLVGEGFFEAASSFIRDGDNNYIYNSQDESHTAGQAWMGFAWNLRTSLVALLGQTQGVALAENLILPVFWADSPNIPAAVREVALRDSPDGNLTDGPHFAQILTAANNHGLGYLFVPTTISWATPANGSTVQGAVAIQASASGGPPIVLVQFSVDGAVVATANQSTLNANWDTTVSANGVHTLQVIVYTTDGLAATATRSVTVSNLPQVQAVYDSQMKAPACHGLAASCNSGGLLNGRGTMAGGTEPNRPNTLFNSCMDGTAGTYHQDESNDQLRVSTLDGQPFAVGKTVKVEATVWAFKQYVSDALDLYYTSTANAPVWTYLTTLHPSAAGAQVLSTTFTLTNGTTEAIRANFRYGGAPSPCSLDSYSDDDDLVFDVQGGSSPPTAKPTNVLFSNATSNSLTLSWNASISSVVAGYRVDVATDALFTSFVTGYQNVDVGPSTTILLQNLASSTNYYARVRAYAPSGTTSDNSSVAVGQTLSSTEPPNTNAVYDSTLKVPVCASVGSSCDSGPLLNGRASLASGAEPNQPNTLYGSCQDGPGGTYHQDESNDQIRVSTLDGQPFAVGKTVKVEATVWAYSAYRDSLDLYYTASTGAPNWIYVTTLPSTKVGAQVLSATYTLPVGAFQAVRASFHYGGLPTTCSGGPYDEADDLAFAVGTSAPPPGAPIPPTGVVFTGATASSLQLSWNASTGPPAAAGYRVDVSSSSLFTSFLPGYQNLDVGNLLSMAITSLQPATTYYARVRAYESSGDVSIPSVTAVGSTLGGTPPPSPGIASYDAILQVPVCATAGSSCDSAALLNGRANLAGGAEPNQPNTIYGSCADGTGGAYHVDESLDRIKISSLDGLPLTTGKSVRIEVTVWAYSSYSADALDLFYTASSGSPNWIYLTTINPTQPGGQTLSAVYTLPAGTNQAIRGSYRHRGSPVPCSTGTYDDHDDLAFAVQPSASSRE